LCRAAAGVCVGRCAKCSRETPVGELVLACQPCQWHLCGSCEPVVNCSKCDHRLEPWASQRPGRCDACGKAVDVGEMVMDCRRCDWYLCTTCRPLGTSAQVLRSNLAVPPLPQTGAPQPQPLQVKEVLRCPGHHMEIVIAAGGTCDVCQSLLRNGEKVVSCKSCNGWCVCEGCRANPPGASMNAVECVGLASSAELQCPKGHALKPSHALAGYCDGCRRVVRAGQDVQDCRACNFYLCTGCCHLEQQRRNMPPRV